MSSPLTSGSGAEGSWQERVWRLWDEDRWPDFLALSELDRALLMRGSVNVSLTEERSDSDEQRPGG